MLNPRDASDSAQRMAYMYQTGQIEEAKAVAKQAFGTMGPILLEVLAKRGYTPDEIARKLRAVAENIQLMAEKRAKNRKLKQEKEKIEAEEAKKANQMGEKHMAVSRDRE